MKNLSTFKIQRWAIALVAVFYLSAFTFIIDSKNDADEIGPDDWKDYKSWTKLTKTPNTGDPTGFLSNKHGGGKAYRDVYVNDVGAEAYQSESYPLPAGTIVVKEAYGNKKKYDAQGKAVVTIMVKLSDAEGSADTGNWQWFMGASGSKSGKGMDTRWGKFCASCHAYGQANDFTFMTTIDQ